MIRVFVDFDGTITRNDVGDVMFETFGGSRCNEIVRQYREEQLSAVECFQQECAACGTVDREQLDSFLDRQEIDASFIGFVAFCKSENIDCTILSDGMDYYIRRILQHHGIADVQFKSNILHLKNNTSGSVSFAPEFPFQDEVCTRCASCKRNHMLTMAADDDIIVYIGEGYSDRCPAQYADMVFAKDDLLNFCRQENIPYFEYRSFADIQDRMTQLINHQRGNGSIKGLRPRRGFHHRRQAMLARRDIYLGG